MLNLFTTKREEIERRIQELVQTRLFMKVEATSKIHEEVMKILLPNVKPFVYPKRVFNGNANEGHVKFYLLNQDGSYDPSFVLATLTWERKLKIECKQKFIKMTNIRYYYNEEALKSKKARLRLLL